MKLRLFPLLALLLACALSAPLASASATEATVEMSTDTYASSGAQAEHQIAQGSTSEAQPQTGSLVGILGTVLAAAGLGTVVNLRTKKPDGTFDNHRLDSESDDFGAQMQGYRDGVAAEASAPLQAQLSAAETTRDEYRDTLIDEILRVETLSHTDAEGTLSADFNADDERAFYESLTPKKLALHYKKARKAEVRVEAQTSPDAPVAPEAAYGNVTVN